MTPRRRPSSPASRLVSGFASSSDLLKMESGDTSPSHGPLSVALVYPNTYSVGMSSLGYLCVRQWMRDVGSIQVERVFALSCDGRSLESGRRLGDFGVVAFSVAYEMDYVHLLQALDSSRLSLFASRRGTAAPLVIAGGMAVDLNRHPIYPFVDVLVHGDGRGTIERIFEVCAQHLGFRRNDSERKALLAELSVIEGVEITAGALRAAGLEIPSGHEVFSVEIERAIEHDEAIDPGLRIPVPIGFARRGDRPAPPEIAVSRIVTPRAELGRRVLIEIARGCSHGCGFCWIGHQCRQSQPRSASQVLAACDEACGATECDSVGLIASSPGAHPEIDAICEGLMRAGRKISFSSLRADEISPAMLDVLVQSGQKGLTLAPEVGDEPLRHRLGKPVGDDAFLETIERCLRAGLEEVKLYFMTGLPGETEIEADAIVSFADRVRTLMQSFGREQGRLGELSVNLGIYVPKPLTPLASREAPSFGVVRARVRRIAQALRVLPNTQVAVPSAHESLIQAHLSMDGIESARLLFKVWKAGPQWREAVRDLTQSKP